MKPIWKLDGDALLARLTSITLFILAIGILINAQRLGLRLEHAEARIKALEVRLSSK